MADTAHFDASMGGGHAAHQKSQTPSHAFGARAVDAGAPAGRPRSRATASRPQTDATRGRGAGAEGLRAGPHPLAAAHDPLGRGPPRTTILGNPPAGRRVAP